MFLNLGICWSATITNLCIQLDSLFQLRDDIYVGTYEEQEDIERRILIAKRRLWLVKALVVLMNLLNFLVLTGSCVWFIMVINSSGSEDYRIC